MKKIELILGGLILITLVLNFFLFTGATFILGLSMTCLSMLYMFLGFALFNGIRLRDIFKKKAYEATNTKRIIGALLTGLALAMTVTGILFEIQYWSGAGPNLIAGLIGLTIALIVGGIKYARNRSSFYLSLFKRIAVFGVIGLILLLLPEYKLLELKYRNHPAYVQAFKKLDKDPYNRELMMKLDEEYLKMIQEK